MSETTKPTQQGQSGGPELWPEMPEIRMLLSLRSHESRMRRRLAHCDELCGALESLYRSSRALAASGLALGGADMDQCLRKAPASAHTICSMVRDFAAAVNRVVELIGFDENGDGGGAGASSSSPVAAVVRKLLFHSIDEHTGLRNWDEVKWIGLTCTGQHSLAFSWATAMECVQKDQKRAYPALRPVVLLARRISDEAIGLLDPLTGPIAEERAAAYSITKKLRAQIDHIRSLVNSKCDAFESEMRAVQNAIIKAQSQTMSLVKNLSGIGGTPN